MGGTSVRKDREIKKYEGDGKQAITNDIADPITYSHPLQMIPRFANPHAVYEKTQIVSRKALSAEEKEGYSQPDMSRLGEYNAMVKRTLPHSGIELEGGKKRRKVEAEEVGEKAQAEERLRMSILSFCSVRLMKG